MSTAARVQGAFQNDVGRVLTLEATDDLTGTTVAIIVEKPDGTNPATPITPLLDQTGKIATGTTRAGDLDQVGTYKLFLRVTAGSTDVIVAEQVLQVKGDPR